MNIAANVVIGMIASLHVYFFVLKGFLWDKLLSLRTFGKTLTERHKRPRCWRQPRAIRLLGGGPGVEPEPGPCGYGREGVFLELPAGGRLVWRGHGWLESSACAGIARSYWAGAGVPFMTSRKFT